MTGATAIEDHPGHVAAVRATGRCLVPVGMCSAHPAAPAVDQPRDDLADMPLFGPVLAELIRSAA